MLYKFTYETESLEEFKDMVSRIDAAKTTSPVSACNLADMNLKDSEQTTLAFTEVKAKNTRKAKSVEVAVESASVEAEAQGVVTVELTYEDIRKLTLDLIKAKGKQSALDVLEQMKVTTAPDLKQEQYAEYAELVGVALKRL